MPTKIRDIKNLSEEDLEEIYAQYGTSNIRKHNTMDGMVVPSPRAFDAGNGQAKYQLIGRGHDDLIAHARLHMHRDAAQVARIFGGPIHSLGEELEFEHIWEPINYELPYVKASDFTEGKQATAFPSSAYERLHQMNARYEADWMSAAARITYADMNIDWLYQFGCSYSSCIDETHPDWTKVFNVFRRKNSLPSIELKVGNKYVIQSKNRKHQRMELVRIVNPDGNFPDCYFKDAIFPGKGATNISIMKIINDINEKE